MKPLRAFPFPLNIGTDICQISRIYGILNSPRAARFVDRILSPEEQSWNESRLRSVKSFSHKPDLANDSPFSKKDGINHRDPALWKAAAFIAGRFAAKEAAIKAHSHRRLTFHDVIIERRGRDEARLGSGPPVARIRAELAADEDVSAMISISHDGDYATAVCLACDPSVTLQAGDET